MEKELRNLIKVWISALISISYCYFISSKISKGLLRLLSVLPVCILFFTLPLFLSSVHFIGISSLFLSWFANFGLILFAFDQGPLYPLPSKLSRFICLACFPVKTRKNPSSNTITDQPIPNWLLAVKVLILGFVVYLYKYRNRLPWYAVFALYFIHVYIALELILVFVGSTVSTILGFDIEPVFNEPYLSTSRQDFWSRRWNLVVSAVLRTTVHIPVQRFFKDLIGLKWAVFAGVMASFIVSGLMHELLYFYLVRLPPTWEVTCFFVLHGVATAIEMDVKRTMWLKPPHRAVSSFAVVGFVSLTGVWLFLPKLLRNNLHERAISEYQLVIDFAKSKLLVSSS